MTHLFAPYKIICQDEVINVLQVEISSKETWNTVDDLFIPIERCEKCSTQCNSTGSDLYLILCHHIQPSAVLDSVSQEMLHFFKTTITFWARQIYIHSNYTVQYVFITPTYTGSTGCVFMCHDILYYLKLIYGNNDKLLNKRAFILLVVINVVSL